MLRRLIRPAVRLAAAATLLAGLAAPAQAQFPFIATYPGLEPTYAEEAVGYDRIAGQFVLAGLRDFGGPLPTSDLALEVILRGSGGPIKYTYVADFLSFKHANWETVAVVSSSSTFAVFLNKLNTSTNTWSSYVVFISRSNPTSASVLHLEGNGGNQAKLRAAVEVKGGWGILGTLDDGQLSYYGSPTFLGVITTTAVVWARSYQFHDPIELGSLTVNGSNLVAGGWYSSFDSGLVTQAAILRVASTTGGLLQAKTYDGSHTDFTMPVQSNNGIAGGDGLVHAVAKTGTYKDPYDLTFFSVDNNLLPVNAVQVYPGKDSTPLDLATAENGVSLAILADTSDPHYLLRLDDWAGNLWPSAEIYDFDTLPGGWDGASLRMLDQGALFPVMAGKMLLNQGSILDETMVAEMDGGGHPDYCVDREDVRAQRVQMHARALPSPDILWVPLTTDRLAISGYGPSDTSENHWCH